MLTILLAIPQFFMGYYSDHLYLMKTTKKLYHFGDEEIKFGFCDKISLFFERCMSKCCIQPSESYQIIEKVEEKMGEELDLIYIVKNMRNIKHALYQRGIIGQEMT